MSDIHTSMDDLSTLKISKRIISIGNEKNSFESTNKIARMIDSHILTVDDIQTFDNSLDDNPTPMRNINKLQNCFEGKDWSRDDSGMWIPPMPPEQPIKIMKSATSDNIDKNQSDSGANRIVTDDISMLDNVKIIAPVPMGGCNKNDPAAIVCTAMGDLTLTSTDGNQLKVKAYFSEQVDGTIISPTTIVTQHKHRFIGWMQHSISDTKSGTIQLLGRNGQNNVTFSTYMNNDLWYHEKGSIGTRSTTPKLNRMSNASQYELWHQRLGHPGKSTMECIHHHATGIPQLKGNSFYGCPTCMPEKLSIKQKFGRNKKKSKISQAATELVKEMINQEKDDDLYLPNAEAGQHFHMDFGFVRGKSFAKTINDKTITSIDGKKAYLIVVDRSTRLQWAFTTSNKLPPIEIVRNLLNKFKSKNPHRTIRVDQGGELGRSDKFINMVTECGFLIEPTGSDASSQNGMAERPNRTYGQMMRCLLHASGLGPEFWSYAIVHATYIKNRLYHHTIKTSPYEKFTGIKPDLANLRIFGSRIYSKRPGRRPYKLDRHSDTGIFLGYTATDKNVIYIDIDTGRTKTSTHVIFDEAHYTTDANKAPLAAQALQRLGYYVKDDYLEDILDTTGNEQQLLVQQLTTTSILPDQATSGSIGYDLYYDGPDVSITSGSHHALKTGIAIKCPTGTYARIAPRSGLTMKNNLTTLAGVIDPDYRGEVQVIIHNFGNDTQHIIRNQKIAQLILEKASMPEVKPVDDMEPTSRNKNGFGSSDNSKYKTVDNITTTQPIIPFELDNLESTAKATKIQADLQIALEEPYKLHISYSPYDNHTSRDILIKQNDKDPTLGMIIQICKDRKLPILVDCKRGSSSIRVQRWKRELKNGYITSINDSPVHTIEDIITLIATARTNQCTSINVGFSTLEKQSMHPQFGIPQLYHDQMNIIGKHLWEIRHSKQHDDEEILAIPNATLKNLTHNIKRTGKNRLWTMIRNLPSWKKIKALKNKKLTRRILMQQLDWTDWNSSEFKQLDQYLSQNTFGKPVQLPKGANLLPLIWTYLIKDCGRKKARCCCNGSPNMKGSVTLGETYAGSLDQTGARIFWAATVINNYITIGADASNAFAEAPPPKDPLYVIVDQQYKDWYKQRFPDQPPIPIGHVLPVQGALQGHPESPRLWAQLIDKIILKLNLKPCTHEPCLYYTDNYNNTGKKVLFLRQVDDFAVSCEDENTAKQVIADINSKMTIDVKQLGIIDRFNGVDVTQTKHYIKLSNRTYIEKFLQRHKWLQDEKHDMHAFPIPMESDTAFHRELEKDIQPTESEIKDLEHEYGFGYRQAIGEIIYAMVTCRPDISQATIKLSQYSTKPRKVHFDAVKQVMRYLNATLDEGLYFWRKHPRQDLPYHPCPELKTDNNYSEDEIHERQQNDHATLFGAVDSDYAGDTTHRKSVSGIVLRLAGGTIFYKTKYQDTIALSSTDAEFVAAAEAGKFILYVRTIMEEIGLPQDMATVLYEDNQGALLIANAQQPTKRTRHVETKHFAIQDWVEKDLLILKRISTTDNYSDVFTKATGRTLFYRHMNYVLGKIRPAYVNFEPP